MLRTTPRSARRSTRLLAVGVLALGGLTAACGDDVVDDDIEDDLQDIQDDIEDGVDEIDEEIDEQMDDDG